MLVSPHDRGVDHHVLVVAITRQHRKNALEDPCFRPPAEPLVHGFPLAEPLGQITPRTARSIAVEHRFDEQAIVFCLAADIALATRQKILDAVPLVVAQGITAHRSVLPQTDHPGFTQIMIRESPSNTPGPHPQGVPPPIRL